MVKKHREKRQKYVDFLRQVEKEREAYIEKRKATKRQREDVANEESLEHSYGDAIVNNQTGSTSKDDSVELGAARKKKHRVEAPSSAPAGLKETKK